MEKARNKKELNSLEKRVYGWIKEKEMIKKGELVLVGVSGGADSVSLLVILYRLSFLLGIELLAVTVHHGIRKDSADYDVNFVKKLCNQLGILLEIERIDVPMLAKAEKISTEEAGRWARYDCFFKLAKKQEEQIGKVCKIAVAHHRQDQAETILHHLFRGSGLTGLAGIRPVRGKIIRPLFLVSREEIEGYLGDNQLSFCIDETNLSLDYTRNKIRNVILPYVKKEINQKADEHIANAAEYLAKADEFIERYACEWIQKEGIVDNCPIKINVDNYACLDEIVKTYVLRVIFKRAGFSLKDITGVHLKQIDDLTKKQVGAVCRLPHKIRIERGYQELIILNEEKEDKKDEIILPNLDYQIISYDSSQKIPENTCVKWFDYDKIKGTLSVRTRCSGDYLQIRADGGRKTIKSLMIDLKIPRQVREEIPLLTEGSHVLWMIGYRISAAYKVTEHTKRVLQVRIEEKSLSFFVK